MSRVASRRLVIDADVACAAASSPDSTGRGKASRDFLEAVLEVCHRAVWTPEIAGEWQKHASRFSRKWRVRMVARKKLESALASEIPGLEKRVLEANPRESDPDAIRKDLHLVYAALSADGLVVSSDDRVRRRLGRALVKASELAKLIWVNPCRNEEMAIDWLKAGAPSEKHRFLRIPEAASLFDMD